MRARKPDRLHSSLAFYNLKAKRSSSIGAVDLSVLQASLHHSRIAYSQAIVRNIVNHHRSGTYDTSFAYCYSGADNDSASKPRVVAYRDGLGGLLRTTALPIVKGMLRSEQLTARSYLHIVTDADTRTIKNHTARVDESALTYRNSIAVVTMERRTYISRFWKSWNELLYGTAVVCRLQCHGLQPHAEFLGMLKTCINLGLGEVIELSRTHLFKFASHL